MQIWLACIPHFRVDFHNLSQAEGVDCHRVLLFPDAWAAWS